MSSSPQKSPRSPQKEEEDSKGWWVIILFVCLIFLIGLGVIFMRSKRTPLMNNKGLMPQINNRR